MTAHGTFDEIANNPMFQPYWGWHDDHRNNDRTAAYMPAVQQNQAEFYAFANVLVDHNLHGGSCLQLGLGVPGASHVLLQSLFYRVWSVDFTAMRVQGCDKALVIVGNTHDPQVVQRVEDLGVKFDLLFIDAGHLYEDVRADFHMYAPLVRSGGIIAMHDALKRPTYEDEIQVWQFVEHLRAAGREVSVIGDELGIAWVVKE